MSAVRRSSARLAAAANGTGVAQPQTTAVQETTIATHIEKPKAAPGSRKRKADTSLAKESKKAAKQDSAIGTVAADAQEKPQNVPAIVPQQPEDEEDAFVPAVLSFDFEEAKKHLLAVDHRFEDLFTKMKCKPFEHLEQMHPFRALATSILGQQISWLAARSITHKFIRLYDPSLPEKPDDEQRKAITFFPSPRQVASTDIAILRTAGLSGRKAEYIQDLATRFADGRLSTQKLMEANDEDLARMLIEVRGIGRWTVDMFAIFSMRRPDILPVGDLGVQKGLVRWFLSLHSPVHNYSLSPEKVGGTATPKKKKTGRSDELATLDDGNLKGSADLDSSLADTSSVPAGNEPGGTEELASLPPTFTPSIKKTLNKVGMSAEKKPVPLPAEIDVALLKGRLAGKKIKGAFLTPQEMEGLTECWKPYRSLGVYYMWSLADAAE